MFRVYHVYQSDDYKRPDYCNDFLYTFTYWFLISSYIVVPLSVGILIYLICVAKVIKLQNTEDPDQGVENAESDAA